MLFSVFCGVSVFDILLIIFATYTYFKNRKLSKKLQEQFKETYKDLKINKEGQIIEKGVDDNA